MCVVGVGWGGGYRYTGFDASEFTSSDRGKPRALAHLRQTHGYDPVVMVGDGATDMPATGPPPPPPRREDRNGRLGHKRGPERERDGAWRECKRYKMSKGEERCSCLGARAECVELRTCKRAPPLPLRTPCARLAPYLHTWPSAKPFPGARVGRRLHRLRRRGGARGGPDGRRLVRHRLWGDDRHR